VYEEHFVAHDRAFISGLITRVIELKAGGAISNFDGTYNE